MAWSRPARAAALSPLPWPASRPSGSIWDGVVPPRNHPIPEPLLEVWAMAAFRQPLSRRPPLTADAARRALEGRDDRRA